MKSIVTAAILAAYLGSNASFGATIGTFESPGGSAKHIKEVNPLSTSGIYWIDPDGSGGDDPFQVYADMDTDGGGWTLVLNSRSGSPSATTDIVSNTGAVSLLTGHTRNGSMLAIDQDAEIRHTIVLGPSVFDGYYSGNYHDQLGGFSDWTYLPSHTSESLLSYHFGMYWTTELQDRDQYAPGNGAVIYGVPWYYRSLWSAIPTVNYSSLPNPPYVSAGFSEADSYSIWVRESVTVVPEPSSGVLLALAAVGVTARRRRRK